MRFHLGFVEDAKQKGIDFDIALHGLTRTFSEMAQGIGGDLQPMLTAMFERWRIQFIDVERGGKGLGGALRSLGVEVFAKTWESVGHLIKGITPGIKRFAKAWTDWLSNADEGKLARFARTIEVIAKVITGIFSIPSYLTPIGMFELATYFPRKLIEMSFNAGYWLGQKAVESIKNGFKLLGPTLDDIHDVVAAKLISWADNFEHMYDGSIFNIFRRSVAQILDFFGAIIRSFVPWASAFEIDSADYGGRGGGARGDAGGVVGGPAVGPGGPAGITAAAGTPIKRSGMAQVTSPSGRTFLVDKRYDSGELPRLHR